MNIKKVLLIAGVVLAIGAFSSGGDSNTSNHIAESTQPTIEATSFPTEEPVYNTPIPTAVPTVYVPPTRDTSDSWSNSGSGDTYINTYGNDVQSPGYYDSVPAGASAQCEDGTYSFSQSRRGTCSHHGGVATWL